jgi:hypothetical protein
MFRVTHLHISSKFCFCCCWKLPLKCLFHLWKLGWFVIFCPFKSQIWHA